MIIRIRKNVFETNSSSTHSLSIVSKEDYEKFEKGELLYDIDNDNLISLEEKKKIEKKCKEKDLGFYEENFQTLEKFIDDECLEYFEEEYKTKSGDKIVAFGKYGYDG